MRKEIAFLILSFFPFYLGGSSIHRGLPDVVRHSRNEREREEEEEQQQLEHLYRVKKDDEDQQEEMKERSTAGRKERKRRTRLEVLITWRDYYTTTHLRLLLLNSI